ncbi:MAG: DUF4247 domain-containing protein [Pseudonocardiaceae bacterium]|nr:DUF4247 domain-containing protein [Pseudonocardiaceae bacterium]
MADLARLPADRGARGDDQPGGHDDRGGTGMNHRSKLVVVAVVVLIGVVAIASAIGGSGGVRGYLADTYARVSGSGDSVVYRSPRSPRTVYDDIRAATSPSDAIVEPDRYFLRYPDDIVAVTPRGGGSTIYLDDEERGYQRWFPVIVPIWGGPFRSPGGGFRGGGPGFGK